MSVNFFCTNLFQHSQGSGTGKFPGASQVPSLKTQGKQTFERGNELCGRLPPHPAVSGPKKLIFVPFPSKQLGSTSYVMLEIPARKETFEKIPRPHPEAHYHWGQNCYIPFFFCLGEFFLVIITGTLLGEFVTVM